MTSIALFGFFPNLDADRVGGVELSGRLAWQGMHDAVQARGETARLFCYGKHARAVQAGDERIVARSKTQAIWRVLRIRASPHVVLVWHLALLKLVPLLRAPRARVVVFLHGIEAWRPADGLTRRLVPHVDLFLSNSQYTYDRFLRLHPNLQEIPYRVVPLGAGAPDAAPRGPAQPPRLLMLSRLERSEDYKGHREILRAWERVHTQIPDAQLWIVGDGNLRADLQELANEHHVQKSVHFTGRVSDAYKDELLRDCRALALPSRGEGFGLVYVEAMRAGRPCLVSDCDAGHQVVNPPEAGLAVSPNDTARLAEAVVRLLTPGADWTAWSQQARARYEANFTAAHFQQRLVNAMARAW